MKTEFNKSETIRLDLILLGVSPETSFRLTSAFKRYPIRLGAAGSSLKLVETGFVDEAGGFNKADPNDTPPLRNIFSKAFIEKKISGDSQRVEVSFYTPAEIAINRKYFVRDPRQMSFDLLVRRIYDRIANIAVDHFNQPAVVKDKQSPARKRLLDKAKTIIMTECPAHWQQVKKRKRQDVTYGGLAGRFVFEGEIQPFMKLLEAATVLGVGRQTASGFGQMSYQIVEK